MVIDEVVISTFDLWTDIYSQDSVNQLYEDNQLPEYLY